MFLFTHIGRLCGVGEACAPLRGKQLAELKSITNAYLLVEGDQIADYGPMDQLPRELSRVPRASRYELGGRHVLAAFCDSHTHTVFGDYREEEFVSRIKGQSYLEIAAAGGGILSSSRSIEAHSEDELFLRSWARLQEAISMGTAAIEIKTGYGLELELERKMLRVIHRIREKAPIPVRVTYLALHALPLSYRSRRSEYLRMVCEEMIPWVASQQAVDYVDVFCEKAFFSVEECRSVLEAAHRKGLRGKVHAEQLSNSGGVALGLAVGARSVDHLERIRDEDIVTLSASDTIATLLPGAAFFLGDPYPPARALIDSGALVALASDFNPGSSPSSNLHMVWSLACVSMRMLAEEAFYALTINGAAAMDVHRELGSISRGKLASLLITRPISSLSYIPYAFGHPWLDGVMIAGAWHREPSFVV